MFLCFYRILCDLYALIDAIVLIPLRAIEFFTTPLAEWAQSTKQKIEEMIFDRE